MTSPASTAAGPTTEELLQFLYLMPVGVIQCDEAGEVQMINPAAARILAPALQGDDLTQLHPVLSRLCPDLLRELTTEDRPLGPVRGRTRYLCTTDAEHGLHVELLASRVQVDQVMVVLLDVTLERQLVAHERAQMTDLNDGIVQRLVSAETALGLGDVATAKRHVSQAADAGRAWLGRQLDLLGDGDPQSALDLVRAERDDPRPGTSS